MTLREYVDSLQSKTVAVLGIGVSNTPLVRLLLEDKKLKEIASLRWPMSWSVPAAVCVLARTI